MGKKDKHKPGQSRNSSVFKVANGRLNKQKGKAKEVTSRLKKVIERLKYQLKMINVASFLQISNECNRKAVSDADSKLKVLQEQSISIIGKSKPKSTKVEPSQVLTSEKADVDGLVDLIETRNLQMETTANNKK